MSSSSVPSDPGPSLRREGSAMPMATSMFLIGPAHPCLPGHFPGGPVVPGVVLLDEVLAALGATGVQPPLKMGLPQVKFREPLLPGQVASIELQLAPGQARFSVRRGETLLASGLLQWQGVDP